MNVTYEEFIVSFLVKHLVSVLGATEKNDSLCKQLFIDAGEILGRHILGVEPKIDQVCGL